MIRFLAMPSARWIRSGAPAAVIALALLGACTAGTPAPRSITQTPPPPAAAAAEPHFALPGGPHVAQVHMAPGLEDVIGANAAQLIAAFGPARLDMTEGDARKLQFNGAACVLDVYLYANARPGTEPRATYVDARRASDGADTDRATCVLSLRHKG